MSRQEKKLGFGEKIAYGMGDSGAAIYIAYMGTFLNGYYTDTVGIAVAAVGTMMLLARIFDGVTDLIMGAVVDKTKSKYGKARPWILWTAPLMAIGLIALFAVPKSFYGTNAALVYAYISYVFLNCIAYTANNLPYNALLSRMTLDVGDRVSTASVRFIMTQVTTLIVNVATAYMVVYMGFTTCAVILAAIQFVMLLWCFLGCKEHIDEDGTGNLSMKETVPLSVSLPALMKNPYFFLQALLFLVFYIGVVGSGGSTFYFASAVLGNITVISILSTASTVPAIIANFFIPGIVNKVGKRKTMIAGAVMMAIGSIIIGAADSNIPLVVVGIVIKGFGLGPIMSGIFALAADVVDYGEWKTGVRSEGLVNSCTSFGMKVGVGLGSAVLSAIMAWGGYEGTAAVQTKSAIASIKFAFGYLGAVVAVICLILILIINIDKHIDQIQADLKAKRQ